MRLEQTCILETVLGECQAKLKHVLLSTVLELEGIQFPLLACPVGSHGFSQHRVEMFDRQCTENQQFQQLHLDFWIFDRISPTFDQSSDGLVPIRVQQYSE